MLASNRCAGSRSRCDPTQLTAQMLSAASPLSMRDQCAGALASGHVCATANAANTNSESRTSACMMVWHLDTRRHAEKNLQQHPGNNREYAVGASQSHSQGRCRRRRLRQDRDHQSRQLDQGPDGGEDDRGRREVREAEAGRHDHRGHVGQHRHGARHRRGGQGLQVRLHHHRQAIEGKSRRAARLWRGSDRLPHRRRSRRSALLLFGVVAPRARDAQLLEGEPVRQSVERAGPLRADRPGNLGADRAARSITWWSASAPAARFAASRNT